MQSIYSAVKKSYKTHLIVWIIFIFYELFITTLSFTVSIPIAVIIFYYSMNILLFYVNAELIYKFSKRYFLIPIIIAVEIVGYCGLIYILELLLTKLEILNVGRGFSWQSIIRSLWRGIYFIGFSVGFVYIVKAIEESKQSERLKTENLTNILDNHRLENELVKLENNYLRSQINPHFLFNTLSFIYNGTRKLAPDAASAILSLSEMMRYALKQPGSSELVNLRDEVEQVENLMNLHRLRTKNKVYVELIIPNDINDVKFLPLVLLTLVENIYKHGNISNENYPAKITIINDENVLSISTFNLKADTPSKSSNGVGMGNIKRRLETFYNDRLTFTFKEGPSNTYITEIKVKSI